MDHGRQPVGVFQKLMRLTVIFVFYIEEAKIGNILLALVQPNGLVDILRRYSYEHDNPKDPMKYYSGYSGNTFLPAIKMKDQSALLFPFKKPSEEDIYYQPVQARHRCYR